MTDLLPPLEHTALISVGGAVNERCVGSAGAASPKRPLTSVIREMKAARDNGARRVVLVGGEPTLDLSHLSALLGAATRLKLTTGLVTNGRMLLYSEVRQRLLAAGVDYLRFSLHGPSAPVHDALVGLDGAFDQALPALKAWLVEAPGDSRVDLACTVMESNLDRLEELVTLMVGLRRQPLLALRLVAPLFLSQAGGQIAKLDAVRRQLGALLSMETDLPMVWEGFPHCAVVQHAHLQREDLRRELPALGPFGAAALPREEAGDRRYPPPCEECACQGRCAGASDLLLEREGDGALRPVEALRANSFNFEHQRDLPGFVVDPEECPALDLKLQGDATRHLLLQRREGIGLYRTPTRDFSGAVIMRVKEQTEQLYLDTSPNAALGELVRHVRRVRAHPLCLTCQHRGVCCGASVIQPGDPFEPQERWLKAQLAGLRGRVLDVGCGEQPYREQIAALVAAGRCQYHGLDPDREALDTLAGSGLDATLHHGRVEDFTGHDGAYRWVLALRTLNHLQDLERGLEVITAALRPGGRLLLSDMTVYGLLRTHDQVLEADTRGGHRQQHFRNWDSDRVLALCRRHPLELLEHHPVTRETSNEWFLLLERRS